VGGSDAFSSLLVFLGDSVTRSAQEMITLAIWLAGLSLMALQLARACTARIVFKYPLFYIYLSFVLLTSSGLLLIYLTKRSYYGSLYWYTEFLGAALGCGVVWEIYRGALGRFPGAARLARNAFVLLLVLAISKAIADGFRGTAWWPRETMVELERDLRGIQGGALIGLVAIIGLYRIPLSANLWGLTFGYGLLVGSNVITLSLRGFLGESFQTVWLYLQPVSYLAVLGVWCAALWSYSPAVTPKPDAKIEQDYQFLAKTTSKALLDATTFLRRTLRP
jgi:hypothetical protein